MVTWDGHMHIDIEPPYLVVKPGLSEDDFYRLAGEDSDWEFLDGRIVMHSPASDRHEDLFGFLMFLFRGFSDEKGGALVRGSRYPMRLDPQWSPEPDILVVREQRRSSLTTKCLEGPADLVVEIVSESDPRLDYREKLPRYRDAGIEEIWIVNPFQGRVDVETKLAGSYAARSLRAGRLDSIVLPGFWIDVAWLWRDTLPPTLQCLRGILRIA
jgi:Uma2 family endonuclease